MSTTHDAAAIVDAANQCIPAKKEQGRLRQIRRNQTGVQHTARHVHCVTAMAPAGPLLLAGQVLHAALPDAGLYVPAEHATHGPPATFPKFENSSRPLLPLPNRLVR